MYPNDIADDSSFLREIPGLLEAIQRRVNELPEYGMWLKHFGHDVRVELERNQISDTRTDEQQETTVVN
jgi:hypothetical protein